MTMTMTSQYPSAGPKAVFPATVEGFVQMVLHDHEWAVGSGYIDPDTADPDADAIRRQFAGMDQVGVEAELRRRGHLA